MLVDTVGKNEKKIAEYIKNQPQEDVMEDQIRLKEYVDRLRVTRIPRHKNRPL